MNPNRNENEPDIRRPAPPPNKGYNLSPEEIRVLRECNNESFFKRCIPISAFLAASTFLGVKNGFLRANARYGATPKVCVSVIVGYFIGKLSYQKKCAERLMQLPNSQLGEVLRQRRRGNRQETLDPSFGAGMSLAPFGNIGSGDVYSDLNPNNSLDLDTTRPDTPGLDDYHRPSLDNPVFEEDEEMPPIQKHTTSYEELRKKNREEYQQKRMGNYKEYTKLTSPEVSTPDKDSESGGKPQVPRNKYGDVWG